MDVTDLVYADAVKKPSSIAVSQRSAGFFGRFSPA